MAYPVATVPYGGAGTSANPAYAGKFIPEIWSGKMIEKFYNATVLAAIANTDYEGEIKNQGDTIKIRTKPTITIRDYQADQPLVVERPSSNIVEFQIDQGKYFNTILDDVMETQSDINLMSLWADDATEQMKLVIDTQVLASLPAQIPTANKGAAAGKASQAINLGVTGTPVVLTPANVLNAIVDLGTVLDEQNIPETGRWLLLPPWVAGMIKKSELRNASISGDGVSLLRNGRIGMIDRFMLYSSNMLPKATEGAVQATHIIAGHQHGLSFASQVSKVETLRSEQTFGTLLRGLQVFGSKVLDGVALADLYAVRGAG